MREDVPSTASFEMSQEVRRGPAARVSGTRRASHGSWHQTGEAPWPPQDRQCRVAELWLAAEQQGGPGHAHEDIWGRLWWAWKAVVLDVGEEEAGSHGGCRGGRARPPAGSAVLGNPRGWGACFPHIWHGVPHSARISGVEGRTRAGIQTSDIPWQSLPRAS